MEEWEKEIIQYNSRIEQIKSWKPKISSLTDKLPSMPLESIKSKEYLIFIRVALFATSGCFTPTKYTISTLTSLWEKGLLVTMSLPIRLTYEIWGASRYAHKEILLKMLKTKDVDKALERTEKLTTGSRSEVQLPWGGESEKPSIHCHDYIRSLTDINANAENDYDFLCESCHPSFLMATYWSMMGPYFNNWSNPHFRDHAHKLIDRSLKCMECALDGISKEVEEILKLAISNFDND